MKFSTFLFVSFLVLSSCVGGFAQEGWMTGKPVSVSGTLLFQTERPIKDNSGGTFTVLTTTPDGAQLLLPALAQAADNGATVRLYGVLKPNSGPPPAGYSGPPLPNIQFVVWKLHAPNEEDTFDNSPPAPVAAPSQEAPFYPKQQFLVTKDTPQRRAIILAIFEFIYGNHKMAVENPQHLQISWSHFYCDGLDALIKITALMSDTDLHVPVPFIIGLHKDAGEKWRVVKSGILAPHGRETFIRDGYPPSFYEGVKEEFE